MIERLSQPTYYTYVYFVDAVPVYVGKGKRNHRISNERCLRHIKTNPKTEWQCWLARQLDRNCDLQIHTDDHTSEHAAFDQERRLVAMFGRHDRNTGTLFNRNAGGGGQRNFTFSDEALQKMRAFQGNRSLEWRQAHSEVMTGRTPSAETRQKTSAAMKRVWAARRLS